MIETPGARVLRIQPLARDPSVRRIDIENVGRIHLDAATVHSLGLSSGAALDERLMGRITEAAARYQARATALRLLGRRLRSRAELEARLRRRGIPQAAILAVIGELRREGWLDDARFARVWIQDRQALRPGGPRRLRAELLARGVTPSVVDEAIDELVPRATEDALAMDQARSRLRLLRKLPSPVARRRLAAWLQRRGYRGEVIAQVLRSLQPVLIDDADAGPAA